MSSRDFGFLTLRNMTAYQPNGARVPPNYILNVDSNGLAVFTDSISPCTINVCTINAQTINVSSISTTIHVSTLTTSSIITSTIIASNVFFSTAYVSTLSTCDIYCADVLTISSFNQTYLGAKQFEYRSADPSTIGTFKVELYGSNLNVYKSTIGTDATLLQNNGGGQLVLGTDEPIIFLNGTSNGNNNVGIGTSNPQAVLHVAEPTYYEEYTSPGLYSFTVPTGAKIMEFEMVAAGGANFINTGWATDGGGGAYMKGTVDVSGLSGQSIIIKVGSVGVYQSASAVQSSASFLSTSSGVLLTMMGAGGSQGTSDGFTVYSGGGGGGGTWTSINPNQFVANGTAGQDSALGVGSAGQGGTSVGGAGGTDYSGGSGGPGVAGITQAGTTPNYTESLGGVIPIGVPGGQPSGVAGIGGNGFSGGGSSSWWLLSGSPQGAGGGGGGSSYYNSNYVTIINSLSGDSYKASPVISGYGSKGENGYVSIFFPATEPAIVTNGAVGIGTTEPLALLDVVGNAMSREIVTSSITTTSASINSGYFGKYTFISTLAAVSLTLPSPSAEGSILVFRNLNTDAASTVTLTNTITGSGSMAANTAAAFVFTNFAGNKWVSF